MTIAECKKESAFYTKEAGKYDSIKRAIFLAVARKYDNKIIQVVLGKTK